MNFIKKLYAKLKGKLFSQTKGRNMPNAQSDPTRQALADALVFGTGFVSYAGTRLEFIPAGDTANLAQQAAQQQAMQQQAELSRQMQLIIHPPSYYVEYNAAQPPQTFQGISYPYQFIGTRSYGFTASPFTAYAEPKGWDAQPPRKKSKLNLPAWF